MSGTSDAAGHCKDAGGGTYEQEQQTIHVLMDVRVTLWMRVQTFCLIASFLNVLLYLLLL